jgi:hypothetical protein
MAVRQVHSARSKEPLSVKRNGSELPANASPKPAFVSPSPSFRASFRDRWSRDSTAHAEISTQANPNASVVQCKALVGAPHDRYEREAEQVADAAPHIEESDRDPARAGGGPLAARIREPMERVLRFDLRGVKVHDDADSDRLNRSLKAAAFTMGRDIFFRRGAYEPETRRGQRLIAHELTHVVQQSGTRTSGTAAPAIQCMPAADAVAAAKSAKSFPLPYAQPAFRKWVLREKTTPAPSEQELESRQLVDSLFEKWVDKIKDSKPLLKALNEYKKYSASQKSEVEQESDEIETVSPAEQKKELPAESKRRTRPPTKLSINPAVLASLPQETQTRFGLEIEPGFGYTLGTTSVKQLKWIEEHWHEPITIASIKPKGSDDENWERVLDITFDDTPEHPAIEIRTEPRVARDLLPQDDVEAVVASFKLDQLAAEQSAVITIGGEDHDVRWRPKSKEWADAVRGYKPRESGAIEITATRWSNIQLTQTIPIGKFLDLSSDEQKLLIPNIPGPGLKTLRDFFRYFAGTNAGQPTTSNRTQATPNIKTPLDTLYQVAPYGGKDAELIKADLTAVIEDFPKFWPREKLKNIGDLFEQPIRNEDFKKPQRQGKAKLSFSVEWNPKLPFYDPVLDDIRVLLEHRASGRIEAQTTSPLRTAILQAIRSPERGLDKKIVIEKKILKVFDKL